MCAVFLHVLHQRVVVILAHRRLAVLHGFAASRKEARQLVRHGHYTLNGKKANIPSILVKAGDVVSVAEGSRNSDKIKLVTEANASRPVPQWLDADKNQLTAKVVRLPAREDVDMDIEEQQIVEFYSK